MSSNRPGVPDDRSNTARKFAKSLRQELTIPERKLWSYLRNRKLARLKFLRQVPIDRFVVDFLCREKRLIVELDGESHATRGTYDVARQQYLENAGYRFARFSNEDVLNDLECVLAGIVQAAGLDVAAWLRGDFGKYESTS